MTNASWVLVAVPGWYLPTPAMGTAHLTGAWALGNSSRIIPVKALGSACAGPPKTVASRAPTANRKIDFITVNLSLYNPTG